MNAEPTSTIQHWTIFEQGLKTFLGGALGQWLAPLPYTPEFGVRFAVSAVWKKQKMFLPHPRVKVSIVGSLRDREVACLASDRQGSNFESFVWRTVSSQSSHHPQKVLLAQFSLYVHKGGLKPDSFHFILKTFLDWWHCKQWHMGDSVIEWVIVFFFVFFLCDNIEKQY